MDLEITVIAEVKKQVEVNVHLDDVIEKMNNLNMAVRWNYIAKILNGIKVEDIEFLSDEQKKLVSNYLLKQSGRFSSALPEIDLDKAEKLAMGTDYF